MKLIEKIKTIITDVHTKEVKGCEVWLVMWQGRYGSYDDQHEQKAKAFLNEESAKIFAKSLREAQKLLQYTEDLCITIVKQN